MSSPVINSKDNPLVRTVRHVAQQSRHSPPELVVAEGVRVLEEAASAGCRPEAALVSEDFGGDPREARLLDHWQYQRVMVRRASAALLRQLSDVVSPQGALALIRIPCATLHDVLPKTGKALVLCLSGIQDPGNLGTLVRSARAAGATLICTTDGTVSARNPKAIRASSGSIFHVPVVEGISAEEFQDYCCRSGIIMYQARGGAAHSCWEADLCGPCAFVLGNEARGLPVADWQKVKPIAVPMITGVESLNVAVAGSILVFEAFRQRMRSHGSQDQDRI